MRTQEERRHFDQVAINRNLKTGRALGLISPARNEEFNAQPHRLVKHSPAVDDREGQGAALKLLSSDQVENLIDAPDAESLSTSPEVLSRGQIE